MSPEPLVSLGRITSAVQKQLGAASRVSLFLDFDGTLVPIAPDPAAPRLDPLVAATLGTLAGRTRLVTTVISGRAVEDLYGRIRLANLIYAGNHGLEIFGRNLHFVEPVASSLRQRLERLCEELAAAPGAVAGVIVEYKGLTASVHYRLAREADRDGIRDAVYAAVARRGKEFRVNPGRKVFEIVPRTGWHKGAAVQWINRQIGGAPLSVYLGDDTTDEDAFSVLPDAITIKVGPQSATCAKYHLPDTKSVHEFLLWLAA